MAARQSTRWLQALKTCRSIRLQNRAYRPSLSLYSEGTATPTSPALLSTIKQDLKTAMRAKDAPRLAVLRAIITTANNAAKTDTPVSTNVQLVALLRKNLHASRAAIAEANGAGRTDLAEKEEAQAKVLEEYIGASGVTVLTEDQVFEVIRKIIAESRDGGVDAKTLLGHVRRNVNEAVKDYDVAIDKKRIAQMVQKEVVGQ